jgi:molybdenum cofactor cytidylyltransferase
MLRPEDTLLVLLAAGRSRRFGGETSKLAQDLGGLPLGLHAAVALAALPFCGRVAVTGDAAVDYAAHGFDGVRNDCRDEGMGTSVQVGVARARDLGAGAVLIVLADMPRITAAHVRRLFDASHDEDSVVASSDGVSVSPPALFGRGQFARLLALTGDAGARDLLRGGTHVVAAPGELTDVDTPGELERLRMLVGGAIPPVEYAAR